MRKLTAVLAAALAAGAALAQEMPALPGDTAGTAPQRIDLFGDWAVFVTERPLECFATSRAVAEDGWPSDAPASQGAQILVTFRPERPGTPGEVSFWTGGRPIMPGTTLTATAGGSHFPLFSDGDWAWPPSAEADAAALATLAAAPGAEITLLTTGMVPVRAQFSLDGFGQAVERARDHCLAGAGGA